MTQRKFTTVLVLTVIFAAGFNPTGFAGAGATGAAQDSAAAVSTPPEANEKPFPLMIGDVPPPFATGEWLQGDPVGQFETGHIYVIDFWATWCAKCIEAMPHISALQDQYRDEVTIIGVNVMEYIPVRVPPFLEKMEGIVNYPMVMDDVPEGKQAIEGKMAQTWVFATGQEDIPLSFIIDRDGRIAWIGYSLDMIDPLGEIVEGNWDRTAFAGEYEQRMRSLAAGGPIKDEIEIAVEHKEWKDALASCGRLLAIDENEYFEDAVVEMTRIASLIVSSTSSSAEELDVALEAARRANELTGWKRVFTISTLASVHYKRGGIARAVELLEQAVELADGKEKIRLDDTLARYRAALQQSNEE